MLSKIIKFSIKNKFIVFLFTTFVIGFGIYSLTQLPIGAVPDVTNNQVQVITTSQNLSTQDIEQFITYPVELEMANIPGVIEIRSISKFGLSVVTIVFEESMGTYLPRQLISEKLTSVREKIPEGFGAPEMGPITTGLGEIYQYILDVKEGYKDQYTATDLRTIQDWIVKRQLSGIKGVVEVNTWGGFLKQYEVSINTGKLNAMNITTADVFTALEKNNSVAGGGYIEKINQAYFIRGEGLMTSLDDIENTVVTVRNGQPILIRDIAKVGFGSAMRFGAITANGEGEKVLGQVMMLKGGNSKQVIEAVKERVKSIEKSLPEGIYINGFLDRSELIAKTTFTVYENIILGSLIVIFIVVLLLGNWRSGLVVASMIPLSLLFTLSLMYIFGVDANLMSLGAIDFGIIIDGSVIIVEFVAFKIMSKREEFTTLTDIQAQDVRDDITFGSASKMMSSAIFGQLIILIVFIPILTLGGIEGKMFKPMAMTFSFALIGAMIFGLTYIPAMAALVIKPVKLSDKNISVRLMKFLTNAYDPAIRWALKSKKLVLSTASVILIASFYLFTTLGAEFVPTLDEGDFVIQPILKTGTSLKKTVEITTKIEAILKEKFPEVKQIVSRIGAAEVPTDPMSMEESDVIITLIPKEEWTSAETKDELASLFKEALKIIPNMEVEFTQPIEMRFNELISGVRSDIAVKIYGEDLEVLNEKANEIKRAISNIDGAADITVEKTAGLPQMNVKFNRSKIARYGLNISDLNDMIAMGFSGRTAGFIFEGEKKFDLVMRLDKSKRQDISDLQNLYVDLPSGGKIPLGELAAITFQKVAAKISRDDTKRRVVVGINVRDRDLQSVVEDIKTKIESTVKLPVGYSITYGGQFENLQSAKARLTIAVPIALILIFVLLYFAFNSVKEALMIYTAIPLSAVGGIFFLWMRDMPFSISAGVGFIALFGIAVLNGIVLIEEFKELKRNGMEAGDNLLIFGAKSRLRAVLLTAGAAALGFLPMAISTGAGAEVQRPLATVVIGGLISSTLLTLLVLPVLYAVFDKKRRKRFHLINKKGVVVSILLLFFSLGINAQTTPLTLEELTQLAIENNAGLKASSLKVLKAETLVKSSINIDKTQVYYEQEKDHINLNSGTINTFGIRQEFLFPTVYGANKKVNLANVSIASANLSLQNVLLKKEVEISYFQFLYAKEKEQVYAYLDSLYSKFSHNATRRFELGETNYLEKITARSKQMQLEIKYNNAKETAGLAYLQLKKIVQIDDDFSVDTKPLYEINLETKTIETNEGLKIYNAQKELVLAKASLEKQKLLPDFAVEYSYGENSFYEGNRGIFQIGLKIPILFGAQNATIKASKIQQEITLENAANYKLHLEVKQQQLFSELKKLEESLHYYENEGDVLSKEIIKTATVSFQHGEIDFFQYIQSIENGFDIKLSYLDNLKNYNQTVIKLNNLTL